MFAMFVMIFYSASEFVELPETSFSEAWPMHSLRQLWFDLMFLSDKTGKNKKNNGRRVDFAPWHSTIESNRSFYNFFTSEILMHI